ncbi:MAG: exonuclease domain-containing protein [Saprospiraceae bacterium]|nr:exonuclease domain-containing protein [Saprospiraceae bacterium]
MGFVILDLEATCWKPDLSGREQEVIEMGACIVSPLCEIASRFSKLIKPEKFPLLSAYCINLTGISQEEINRSRTFDVAWLEFLDWIELHVDDVTGIYCWGKFDREILLDSCYKYGVPADILHSYTDLKQTYACIKDLPKQVGLDRALAMEGIAFEGNRHRALPDAYNLSKLFVKYFDEFLNGRSR